MLNQTITRNIGVANSKSTEIAGELLPYQLVKDRKTLDRTLHAFKNCKVLGIDTETTGLDPLADKVRLIQIASGNTPTAVIDLWSLNEKDKELLKKLLSDDSALKVFHNAKFDLKMLHQAGISVGGEIFDTMLAAKVLDAGLGKKGHKLSELANKYLNIELSKEFQKSDWSKSLHPEQLQYAARDAEVLLELQEVLLAALKESNLLQTAELEFECLPAVMEMELTGIGLDRDKWELLSADLRKTNAQKEAALRGYLGEDINLNSPKQLLVAFKSQGIPITSTNKDTLEPMVDKYPLVKALMEYRKATTLVKGFADKLPTLIHPATNRIHSNYNQLGAVTGRFSCANPNIQQIPRGKVFRECFVPESGYDLVIGDYNQIELRIAAEISQDKRMIRAYQRGKDLHRLTASLIAKKPIDKITKEERQAAKAVNFGLIYAMGINRLRQYAQNTYGVILTFEQAKQFRERFFKAYQGITKWHRGIRERSPMKTRTIGGRRRQWSSRSPLLSELYNTPIQGTAADILKRALAHIFNALQNRGAKMVACVHDEVIIETPKENTEEVTRLLKDTMEQVGQEYLKEVPIVADVVIANSWAGK